MGPYICQKDTPLGKLWQEENPNLDTKRYNEKLFRLSTKMVALARIICGDVNIAATTALQAINPQGLPRQFGVALGVMADIRSFRHQVERSP